LDIVRGNGVEAGRASRGATQQELDACARGNRRAKRGQSSSMTNVEEAQLIYIRPYQTPATHGLNYGGCISASLSPTSCT